MSAPSVEILREIVTTTVRYRPGKYRRGTAARIVLAYRFTRIAKRPTTSQEIFDWLKPRLRALERPA